MSDDYDDYYEEPYYEDDQHQYEEEQVEEIDEEKFIFFGIFSGFFDWLIK